VSLYRKSDLYDKAEWKGPNGLRQAKLRRNPLCESAGCLQVATNVHHLVEHNGDRTLFFFYDNLQALCQSCHSAITAKTHGSGNRKAFPQGGVDENGRVRKLY
jgi:5-methylcytosine-specific restriction endonuclease McrA